MKMAQAIARTERKVRLHAWEGGEKAGENLFSRYGVDPIFELLRYPTFRIRGLSMMNFAFGARRAVRKQPPQLLYGRNLRVMAALADFGVPLAYEAHNPPSGLIEHALAKRLFVSPDFRGLVLISRGLAAEYARLFPDLDARRVLIAHDGADDPGGGAAPVTAWRGRTGHLQVGYVGHLYAGRGIDLILELANSLPDVDFHFVGGTAADLQAWRKGPDAVGANVFWHGFVDHGELSGYFARFDAVLAPYQEEVRVVGGKNTASWMSPLKVFEYMAHRKPIVCSDLPALREIVNPGVEALMPAPRDLSGWIQALERLRDQPDLRDALGRSAYTRFRAEYTWESRAQSILGFVAS